MIGWNGEDYVKRWKLCRLYAEGFWFLIDRNKHQRKLHQNLNMNLSFQKQKKKWFFFTFNNLINIKKYGRMYLYDKSNYKMCKYLDYLGKVPNIGALGENWFLTYPTILAC